MSVHKYRNSKNKVLWYVKYKNHTKRGFETKSSAELYEAKLRANKDNIDSMDFPFIKIVDDYLEHSKNNLTYGTYMKSWRLLKEIIIPLFPQHNKKISKITELDCLSLREEVNKSKYSTVYKNDILARFRAVFNYAKKYYRLSDDPSSCIEKIKMSFTEKKKEQLRKISIWNYEEFGKFIANIQDEKYKLFFIILYLTGMRLGEVLALTWQDFDGESFTVNKSLTRKTDKGAYEIKEPKTVSSNRVVSLNKSLIQKVEDYQQKEKAIPGYKKTWFIFGRIKPFSQTNLDRIKDSAVKKAGIKRIRIHDLRHSHASNLIAEGVNIVAVSKRLGHSDINMTLKVYTHLLQKTNDEMIEVVENSTKQLFE